jgi:hypothetical protein
MSILRVVAAVVLSTLPVSSAFAECPDAQQTTSGLTLPFSAVRYLADDALGGRLAGSAGERCAADYVAKEFERLGLRPAGEAGSYFQNVPLASALNPHATGGTGRNVIGALEGTDPALRRQWIVIGAHIDHLGEGGAGSLAPGEKAIHNGADDNASGIAALLRSAELLATGRRPARSIAFVAFTGEESGLLGSSYFAAHPTLGDGTTIGMINLDMVGRLGAGPLIVYGVDTAEEWRTLVEQAAKDADVPIASRGDGYGPSDHTSFYVKDVPVLHLFTNSHGDYHKPSDDYDKIDRPGLERVSSLVAKIVHAVSARPPVALTLRRGAGTPPRAGGPVTAADSAYLGTVPDFTPVDRGVKLSGVTAGSPADRAGLKAGDVVVGIGTHEVADLQAMTDALRAYKPGQTVPVRVLRNADVLTLQATLGSRANR